MKDGGTKLGKVCSGFFFGGGGGGGGRLDFYHDTKDSCAFVFMLVTKYFELDSKGFYFKLEHCSNNILF